MPTTVLATALPHSLADDAPFQLTVFLTHKLVDGALLSDFPAAADWPTTLAGCTFALETSLGTSLPLRVVSVADAASWAAVLPPGTVVDGFPTPVLSDKTWRTNPASRMSDHAVDLHLAAITAAPLARPALAGDPVAGGLLRTLANLDQGGPLWRLLGDEAGRARRHLQVTGRRLRDALTTIGPLTEPDETDPERGHGREIPPLPPYQSEITDQPSPVQVLLDDPEADTRVTKQLDAVAGQDLSSNPQLQMMADAHAMRRYYERPEQPQQASRKEPDPNAPPTPRPNRPKHDFHAKVGSFGATPALLRRLGLAVDVVLDGLDAGAARAALKGAGWVSVTLTSPALNLQILSPRKTSVVVDGSVFAARSSTAWVGGLLPLGDPEWVVLDVDPDASGLKLDQYTRNLARQYASEANGDPATSAPGTLRSTGFALARRERAAQLLARVQEAEKLAADDGTRELLLDDLVRGIRVEVWDDVTRAWHSLHQRRVTVTGEPGGVGVLDDVPDAGFLQLSALNRAPDDQTVGYYLHEVVAGWDGWSLSAPRPGLTIVHVEPPSPDGATEVVVDTVPDAPIDGAHTVSRVEPGSLPRLRYGTSYSFRVLAVDLAGNSVPQVPLGLRRTVPPSEQSIGAALAHLERVREAHVQRDNGGVAEALRANIVEHLRAKPTPMARIPDELLTGNARIDATLANLVAQAAIPDETASTQRVFDQVAAASRVLAESQATLRVRPQLRIDAGEFASLAANEDLLLPDEARVPVRPVVITPRPYLRWEPIPAPALVMREKLTPGEQPAALVVRRGSAATSERHIAPPKATQLEAEAAGKFDAAIGTGDAAEIRRLYGIALAERGTLLDQFVPSLTDATVTDEQPGIALVDRPGADTGSPNRATLAEITVERGRPIGEGQYVVHDTDALRLPYLPDPYATGVSLVFYEAGSPHVLPEPRALQAVAVPYPGEWPSLQPLRIVVEPGDALEAQVIGHEVHVQLPPGEQVRVALSSTLNARDLDKFGLWRSHLASAVGASDGFKTDEVVATAALMRAASAGWTWWLTPSTDVRLVHAVPEPVRPPELSALTLFLRPPGRSVAAFTGLVDVHGSSTDTVVCTGIVDRNGRRRHRLGAAGDVQVRCSRPIVSRGAREDRRAVPLRLPADRSALAGAGRDRFPPDAADVRGHSLPARYVHAERDDEVLRILLARRAARRACNRQTRGARHPVVLPTRGAAGTRLRAAAALGVDGRARRPVRVAPHPAFGRARLAGAPVVLVRRWRVAGRARVRHRRVGADRRRNILTATRGDAGTRRRDQPMGSGPDRAARRRDDKPDRATAAHLRPARARRRRDRRGGGRRDPSAVARRGHGRARPRLARQSRKPGRGSRIGAAAGRFPASRRPGAGLQAGVRQGDAPLVR